MARTKPTTFHTISPKHAALLRQEPWTKISHPPSKIPTRLLDPQPLSKLTPEPTHLRSTITKLLKRIVHPAPTTQTSAFALLPTELLLQIQSYLSPSTALLLSQTCRRFRQSTTVQIGDLFPSRHQCFVEGVGFLHQLKYTDKCRMHTDCPEEAKLWKERCAFLCVLEKAGGVRNGGMVCSGCKAIHDAKLFNPDARGQEPERRLCRGREGRVWICPHRKYDFTEMQLCPNVDWLYQEMRQHTTTTQVRDTCSCQVHYLADPDESLRLAYKLFQYKEDAALELRSPYRVVWYDQIQQALSALKLPFCPHINSDDPGLVKKLGHRRKPGVIVRKAVHRLFLVDNDRTCEPKEHHCRSCGTSMMLQERRGQDGNPCLAIVVTKNFPFRNVDNAKRLTVTHPNWIKQLIQPKDADELESKWKESEEISDLRSILCERTSAVGESSFDATSIWLHGKGGSSRWTF